MLHDTIAVVLADDPGDSLGPLTRERTKAAVPFGGEYRVIDFALSNCLHSGIRRVLVPTGDRAYSLQKHLRDGWSVFNPELDEYVTPVPPRVGEADGMPASLGARLADMRYLFDRSAARRVLIVDGGHVYRMDYAAMLAAHAERGNAVTVGCIDVDARRGRSRPRVEVSGPAGAERVTGLDAGPAGVGAGSVLRAMGVYAIDMDALLALLEPADDPHGRAGDFEFDLLDPALARLRVGAYRFGGTTGRVSRDRYWNDVATLDDYFSANLSLLEPVPPLDLYQSEWQIRARAERNPPARTVGSATGNEGIFVNSIVSNGTIVRGGAVSASVLFPRVRVEDGATVEKSIVFHGVEVGAGAALRECIVDKGARIAPGDRIGFDRLADAARFDVTPGGVVVIGKGVETEVRSPVLRAG